MKKVKIILEVLILLVLLLIAFLLIRDRLPSAPEEEANIGETWIFDEEALKELGDFAESGSILIGPDGEAVYIGVGTVATDEATDAVTETPAVSEPQIPERDRSIEGEWYRWDKGKDTDPPQFGIAKYEVRSDGIAYHRSAFYTAGFHDLDTQTGSYEVEPMDYSYDGSTLIIDGKRMTARVKGNKLTLIENDRETVYIRGNFDDAVAQIHEKYFDSYIRGTWYYVDHESTPPGEYIIWKVTFGNDRPCREAEYSYYDNAENAADTAYRKDRPYFYDGKALYSEFSKTAARIEDGVLLVALYGNEYAELRKGDVDDAVAYIRETFRAPETQPPATEPAVIDPAILGTWQHARADRETMRYFHNGEWTFNADGTFEYTGYEATYIYSEEEGLVYDENQMGSGSQMMTGIYAFDGSTLKLTYTWIEFNEDEPPFTETHQIRISGDEIHWSDNVLYKGSAEDVAKKLLG